MSLNVYFHFEGYTREESTYFTFGVGNLNSSGLPFVKTYFPDSEENPFCGRYSLTVGEFISKLTTFTEFLDEAYQESKGSNLHFAENINDRCKDLDKTLMIEVRTG